MNVRTYLVRLLFAALLISVLAACGGGGGGGGDETAPEPTDDGFDPGPPRELVVYIQDNFDGGAFSPLWTTAGVREEIYQQYGQPAFVSMDGHGEVLHYFKAPGTDEVTPASVTLEGDSEFQRVTGKSSIDEFYIEWSELFPDDHVFAQIGQKLLRFTYYHDGEERGLELNWAVLNSNSRMQLFVYHPNGLANSAGALDLGLDTGGIPVGRWVRFGVWGKMNTPGEADGYVRVYMDGVPILTQARMSLRGDDARGWNVMWLGGNYSNGPGGSEPRESHRYLDDIRFYSTKPQ